MENIVNNTMNGVTILNVLSFFLDKEIYDKHKIVRYISNLDKNVFSLGGHMIMEPDDIINLELIEKVKNARHEHLIKYGSPCNSFEIMSIRTHDTQLELIEDMVKKYMEMNIQTENNTPMEIDNDTPMEIDDDTPMEIDDTKLQFDLQD